MATDTLRSANHKAADGAVAVSTNITLRKHDEVAAEDVFVAIGDAIAQVRNARGITQSQLSQLTGITQADISRIEHGTRNPMVGTLLRLAQALDCQLEITLKDKQENATGGGALLSTGRCPKHPGTCLITRLVATTDRKTPRNCVSAIRATRNDQAFSTERHVFSILQRKAGFSSPPMAPISTPSHCRNEKAWRFVEEKRLSARCIIAETKKRGVFSGQRADFRQFAPCAARRKLLDLPAPALLNIVLFAHADHPAIHDGIIGTVGLRHQCAKY